MRNVLNILKKKKKEHLNSIPEVLELDLKNSTMERVGGVPKGTRHTISPVAALDVLGLECGATNSQLIEAYKSKSIKGPDGEFVTEKINRQAFEVLAEFGTHHKAHPDGFRHLVGLENPYVGHHIRITLRKVTA